MSFEKLCGQYAYVNNMVRLYNKLQDDQSKEIFWARLQFEAEPNLDHALALGALSGLWPEEEKLDWKSEFENAVSTGKKIVLYGAGAAGQTFANLVLNSGADFYAFCDRKKSGTIVCGKSVLQPEEIVKCSEHYAVVICTTDYYEEILQFLRDSKFPQGSILRCSALFSAKESAVQYCEFSERLRSGTAIVDAGCYDGVDTIRFYHWCDGTCSKIYAFEPDESNYDHCAVSIKEAGLPNVALIKAGLSDVTGEATFASASNMGSYLVHTDQIKLNFTYPDAEISTIHTVRLDDIVDTEIGLIKMDIEGTEFDALHGAKEVIQRDRPLLAICVYHRQGDMLAIMDHLQDLVPEYRFWIRHYETLSSGTVLYAAV